MKINGMEFRDVNDIMRVDTATCPLWIENIMCGLWEEANDRGLEKPNQECLDAVLENNPGVYRVEE